MRPVASARISKRLPTMAQKTCDAKPSSEVGKIRWGILGTGSIAHAFAQGLSHSGRSQLQAVGSRRRETAEAFGEEFNVPNRHGSYESLAGDDDVDVIYVSTPHHMHKDNSILCLEAGKAVLCEKPFTINAAEAREVVSIAREKGLFCMEAMWMRFIPSIVKLRRLLADGAIGRERMIIADFGFRANLDPTNRLFDPAMGGGGLLDVGVYPISLASMVFGPAQRVAGLADIGQTGVDEQAGIVLGYAGQRMALVATGVRTNTPREAVILGADGQIRLHAPWWKGGTMTLTRWGNEPETIDIPTGGNGYNYQADEVVRCLSEGKTQSRIMPLDETVSIMRTLDSIRAQWGLKYPME